MTSLRPTRATYVAAFLLGGLIALILARPARSAEPFRLDRIGVVGFSDNEDGTLRRRTGVLELDGRVTWRIETSLPRPANTPDWALRRTLITVQAWQAYRQLGPRALENFELAEGSVRFAIGNEDLHFVAASPMAAIAAGRMTNISTRGRITAGGDQMIAGFVIEERPRMVLVRAVGPGLARFGVAPTAYDPFLVVRRNGAVVGASDDWSMENNAAEIREVTTRVGAFPLDEGSRDAARLLVLPPGAYTVHAETAGLDFAAGSILVEVYSVPDDPIYVSENVLATGGRKNG